MRFKTCDPHPGPGTDWQSCYEEADKHLSEAERLNRDETNFRELNSLRQRLNQKLSPDKIGGN
jgi:hypothetical protein